MTEDATKEAASSPKTPEPCAIVIFGAFGDLTKRLVMPAIYNLGCEKSLPDKIALIGVDLAESDADAWRKHLHDMMESFVGNSSSEFDVDHIEEDTWKKLADTMAYVRGDMTKPDLYKDIGQALDKAGFGEGNVIFYFAIADRFFAPVARQLGDAELTKQGEKDDGVPRFWRRVVVEKPFGHDVESAMALNKSLLKTLEEDQIFRIDHFLGKETVQSIMTFRFANGMFEPIWNRDRIDSVQITAAEVVGVEARGKFYEVTGGAARHDPQPPVHADGDGGDGAAGVVRRQRDPRPQGGVVLVDAAAEAGRRRARPVRDPARSRASRPRPIVRRQTSHRSRTAETYVAMRVGIDSWRWAGVPFYLRTGKHMPDR